MKLAYLKQFWDEYQIKASLEINPYTNPSLNISGDSGTGKSSALLWMIRNLLKEHEVDLWFCSFKDSLDFKFMKGYKQYFTGKDCARGFELFYQRFCEIQINEGEAIKYGTILVFDEFSSFILHIQNEDKKQADRYTRMLGEMLLFFRSYKGGCWIISQMARSEFFGGGRDSFHGKILLTRGRPSKEALAMLGLCKEDLKNDSYKIGEGVAYIDGMGLFDIKYPMYDHKKIEAEILALLERVPSALP